MPYNGEGTFNRLYNWVTDKANSINITASRMDAEQDGIATGLSNCITKDGQTTLSANIPFNSKKITGFGNGSDRTDSIALGQVQDNTYGNLGAAGGSANTYTASPSPAITAYTASQRFTVEINADNTGASTLNISAVGAEALEKYDNIGGLVALTSKNLRANKKYDIIRNQANSKFIVLNPEKPDINPNLIINGDGRVRQDADLTLTTSYLYGKGDMFAAKATGTITAGTFTAEDFSLEPWFKFAGVTLTGGTDKLHAITAIESDNVKGLINNSATFSLKVNHNVGSAFDVKIVVHKANSKNDFTALTTIATSAALSVADAVDTEIEFTIADMGDCSNGVAVELQYETGIITTKNIYFTNVKVEKGSVKTEYEYRNIDEEHLACMRYYEKTYDIDADPGSLSSNGIVGCTAGIGFTSSGSIYDDWVFKAAKFRQATITFYNQTTGGTGTWRDSGSNDITMGLAANGKNGILFINNSTATTHSLIKGHIVANARFQF